MIIKWLLLLNKSIKVIQEKLVKLFSETSFLLGPKMLSGVVCVALLPPFMIVLYSAFLFYQEQQLNEKMYVLEKKVKSLVELKGEQERFIREFGLSSPLYLQKTIEVTSLLKEDRELLSKLEKFSDYEPIQKRKEFLESSNNQIHFISLLSRTSKNYAEAEWKLEHPIELSSNDLIQIISKIEGGIKDPLRPQLIIKKITLKKKSDNFFDLDLDILQRSLCEKN